MGHHMSTRISEHIRDTRLENHWSAVARNSTATKHSIDFNRTVIYSIHVYRPCIIREATEINKHPHNFNCEDWYRLSKVWLHLFSTKPPTQPPLPQNNHWHPYPCLKLGHKTFLITPFQFIWFPKTSLVTCSPTTWPWNEPFSIT
jgi:hypothetical protein